MMNDSWAINSSSSVTYIITEKGRMKMNDEFETMCCACQVVVTKVDTEVNHEIILAG